MSGWVSVALLLSCLLPRLTSQLKADVTLSLTFIYFFETLNPKCSKLNYLLLRLKKTFSNKRSKRSLMFITPHKSGEQNKEHHGNLVIFRIWSAVQLKMLSLPWRWLWSKGHGPKWECFFLQRNMTHTATFSNSTTTKFSVMCYEWWQPWIAAIPQIYIWVK